MATRTLISGWHMDPENRNRMISPSGERVTYYQYRNQAAKQEGYKSYNEKRKIARETNKAVRDVLEKSKTQAAKELASRAESGSGQGQSWEKPVTRLFAQAEKEIREKGFVDEKTKDKLHNLLGKLQADGVIDSSDAVFYSTMRALYKRK